MAKRGVEEVYNLPRNMAFEMCKFRCINEDINNSNSTCNFSTYLIRQPSNVKIASGLFIQDHYQNVNELVPIGDGEEDEYVNNRLSCSSGVSEDFLSGNDSVVIGCNNGVVVYVEKPKYFGIGHQLCVIDPLTLQRRTIPHPTTNNNGATTRLLGSVTMLSGRREGYNVDYNLVCFLPTGAWDNCVEYHVYSFRENRWMEESNKRFDVGSRSLNYERPILVEETIYLVSDCSPAFDLEPYIVGIDVEQKTSKFLPLPLPLIMSHDCKIEIANWGDRRNSSLCLICWCRTTSSFIMWTVEDRKAWTWRNTPIEITLQGMGLGRSVAEEEVTCFTIVNGDKLVFDVGNSIHVYDLRNGRRRRLNKELSGGYLTLFPYTQCPR